MKTTPSLFSLILSIAAVFPVVAFAQTGTATEKPIIQNESGFIVCSGGGTQNPMFTKDCKNLNISRISGGGIKYEGICIDSNSISFYLACDAISFEYQGKSTTTAPGTKP